MDLAIIGAAGSCGRQLAAQLLERRLILPSARLQLVGHHGGRSADELWGLRADLEDAFVDHAPSIEVVLEPSAISADLVVMLAGITISTDPNASVDRALLGHTNRAIFEQYAEALAARSEEAPIVVVQSNPVELGVEIFADRLGRKRVLGAGAWSDTLRLRSELAVELELRRPQINALLLGQHGDHAVPAWSQIHVRGVPAAELTALVTRVRAGRTLAHLPDEIRAGKARMLELVRRGEINQAYTFVQTLPPDLRSVVKPFFTHFTAGRTTEMATAHAVADIVSAYVSGEQRVLPAQVLLDAEWLDFRGVLAAPIVLSPDGWERVYSIKLADDEIAALAAARDAIANANAAAT